MVNIVNTINRTSNTETNSSSGNSSSSSTAANSLSSMSIFQKFRYASEGVANAGALNTQCRTLAADATNSSVFLTQRQNGLSGATSEFVSEGESTATALRALDGENAGAAAEVARLVAERDSLIASASRTNTSGQRTLLSANGSNDARITELNSRIEALGGNITSNNEKSLSLRTSSDSKFKTMQGKINVLKADAEKAKSEAAAKEQTAANITLTGIIVQMAGAACQVVSGIGLLFNWALAATLKLIGGLAVAVGAAIQNAASLATTNWNKASEAAKGASVVASSSMALSQSVAASITEYNTPKITTA